MKKKIRLDLLVVEQGLAPSRAKAQSHIMAGEVFFADGERAMKSGHLVDINTPVHLKSTRIPYVSRGGFKLAHALQMWPIPLKDAICLDVGAGTGGFTDVLLRGGAAQVFCVDVGYGQLAWKLQTDPRVIQIDRTHILKIPPLFFSPPPTLAVIDVSFISLAKVLPGVLLQIAPEAFIFALIKPQFEVAKNQLAKGGIVRDEQARQEAVQKILHVAQEIGLNTIGYTPSPITGADGNVEYLAFFHHIRPF